MVVVVVAASLGIDRPRRSGRSAAGREMSWSRHTVAAEAALVRLRSASVAENQENAVPEGSPEEAAVRRHLTDLPPRYAADVRDLADVLTHARLLAGVRAAPAASPRALQADVRPVDLYRTTGGGGGGDGAETSSAPSAAAAPGDGPPLRWSRGPTFGSTVSLEMGYGSHEDNDSSMDDTSSYEGSIDRRNRAETYEVTIAAKSQPKLLGTLSTMLSDVGLNILEAHVFSTSDGFALDVFVVSGLEQGWTAESLWAAIAKRGQAMFGDHDADDDMDSERPMAELEAPPEPSGAGPDPESRGLGAGMEWEIQSAKLHIAQKVASGSFGDLYRGSYCGQEVAVKMLRANAQQDQQHLLRTFMHELSMLRRVRHKHIVQLIGACTTPPKLCLVTEFVVGGSVLEWLHRSTNTRTEATLVKLATGVALGMDYLHRCNIIHRDLKAANLLLDEFEVVKVTDFGVARVRAETGVMTAETGTYRWMAPEVVAHQQYDHKCDVFSYGILLWELVTGGAVPYAGYSPLQAAVGVVQKGLRPTIPSSSPKLLTRLMQLTWAHHPNDRPEFAQIIGMLDQAASQVGLPRPPTPSKKGFLARSFSAITGKSSTSSKQLR